MNSTSTDKAKNNSTSADKARRLFLLPVRLLCWTIFAVIVAGGTYFYGDYLGARAEQAGLAGMAMNDRISGLLMAQELLMKDRILADQYNGLIVTALASGDTALARAAYRSLSQVVVSDHAGNIRRFLQYMPTVVMVTADEKELPVVKDRIRQISYQTTVVFIPDTASQPIKTGSITCSDKKICDDLGTRLKGLFKIDAEAKTDEDIVPKARAVAAHEPGVANAADNDARLRLIELAVPGTAEATPTKPKGRTRKR